MGSKKKIAVSWSGGKDAALALHHVLHDSEVEVKNLHCVINEEGVRVGLHGVRESLIQQQADEIGIPLVKAYLKSDSSNQSYEALVSELYRSFRDQGITHVLFGDIFLDELKAYREKLLGEAGVEPLFPLWKKPSRLCVESVIKEGFQTVVCAANEACYQSGILGKVIDDNLLQRLPRGVDPSGENGEFHTFVFNAPYFKNSVDFSLGRITSEVYNLKTSDADGTPAKVTFYFQDLLPTMKDLKASNKS
jgi:uncharacterized protein (TIGR00290 family)